MSIIDSMITDMMFESQETAQQILDTKMPGYTIELLESGAAIILNPEGEIIATIETSK
jgi:hypothetical protein